MSRGAAVSGFFGLSYALFSCAREKRFLENGFNKTEKDGMMLKKPFF